MTNWNPVTQKPEKSELPEVPKNPPFNVWIEWVYTEENPFPKLDGDPLVHVRFKDGSASTDDGIGVRPISGWHDNGDKANCFEQKKHLSKTIQIIAYLLVDPNDHDKSAKPREPDKGH